MGLYGYTLWKTYKKLLKIAIAIVDLPMKHDDFPWLCLFTRGYRENYPQPRPQQFSAL
jgi:hypothetical protein